MADTTQRHIAEDSAYTITCPYCFNRASGGNGEPIPHTKVLFRSGTYFSSVRDIEQKLGFSELDIEMMNNGDERTARKKAFATYKNFLLRKDPVYQAFWDNFEGRTTEQPSRSGNVQNPWELPIIGPDNGVTRLVPDMDGFVTQAVDVFGKTTHNRVCPFCHNPFPLGFGKNPVKYISIIGITGSGKTVYISQLLKNMTDFASKVGLNAYFTSDHETNFIENNAVKKGVPLPDSTTQRRLSQPMFYDIVRNDGNAQRTDTIVLYDIAGENCRRAEDMENFAQYVKHSDGLILLIDPKQLGFLSAEMDEDEIDEPSLALNTLWSVLENRTNRKCQIPVAVCVSKSDQCYGILPPIAQETVHSTGTDPSGLPVMEFDGKTLNELVMGNHGLKDLMLHNAQAVCQNLSTGYWNYNFFSVSATGCACAATEQGFYAPVNRPEPKRIEEPVLWMFRQFGFIRSNARILRPFKIKHADRYIYRKKMFGKSYLEKLPDEFAQYEDEYIRTVPQVLVKNTWVPFTDEYRSLPIMTKGE